MASGVTALPSQSASGNGHASEQPNGSSAPTAATPKLRKRTKTGCLTCRKRRIKCGEERPVCNNCIKSKRHCEGYNQRVVFKPPIGDWPTAQQGPANTLPYHTGVIPGAQPIFRPHQPGAPIPAPLTPLQPRPSGQYDLPSVEQGQALPTEPLSAGGYAAGVVASGLPPGGAHYLHQVDSTYVQTPQSAIFPFSAASVPPVHPSQHVVNDPNGRFTSQYIQQTVQYPGQAVGSTPHLQQQSFTARPPTAGSQQAYTNGTSLQQPYTTFQQEQKPFSAGSQLSGMYAGGSSAPAPGYSSIYQPSHSTADHHFNAVSAASQPPAYNDLQWQAYERPLVSHDNKPALKQDYGDQTPIQASFMTQPLQTPFVTSRFAEELLSPTQALDEAAVEYEDDDYYDVNSDDDMDITPDQMTAIRGKQKDFGLMLDLHRQSTSELSMRRYDSFIYYGILDHYRPERVANPLRNEKTARVFAHFIHATGPSLSISERRGRNTSALFSESPVPASQQSLWTYTLPMMALNHQGLLHAMLALASGHIAKLQGASITPSFKHYAYALKRIHHCVGHPKKRHQVTTLAASLLLGYYEVMTADHVKWTSHLVGAKQLLVEIDYAGMTKEYRRQKAMRAAYEQNFAQDNPELLIQQRQLAQPYSLNDDLPDEALVSTLIGRKLRYDEYGQVVEEPQSNPRPSTSIPQPLDISKYEIYQDLFWWYCTQDCIQSIVSGNRLLMDYSRWSDCPPRGPIGKGQAVYATIDHLMLLLGRVADFAARDRPRKIKAVEAMGGHWRPQPGMPMAPPPGAPRPPPGVFTQGGPPPGFPMGPPGGGMGAPPVSPMGPAAGYPSAYPPGNPMASSPVPPAGPYQGLGAFSGPRPNRAPYPPHGAGFPGQQMPQPPPMNPQMPQQRPPPPMAMPSFYGMAPTATPTAMPSAYASNKRKRSDETPSPKSKDNIDLEAATASAIEEWNQICHAIQAFHARLGPAFQPLPAELHQPISTPFGEALQYRSYDISVVWASLHMIHIIAIRSHPHMPPAAMIAAGVAATATAELANEIGRISAGITLTPKNMPLNPSLGGALVESCMPLFFAGIQYQDAAQRGWLVSRILDIEERTGWASAGLIARGCETAWVKAAQLGRGPPYYKKHDETSDDDRLAGRVVTDPMAEPPRELTDRRCIWTNAGTRVHWAMGLLAAEEDVVDSPPAASPSAYSPYWEQHSRS